MPKPSDPRAALQSILVAGNGAIGLAAAIALRRALPRTKVSIAPCPADPRAFADSATTSLPGSNVFHQRIGLDEAGFVNRAGASHRLATRFTGWRKNAEPWLHAYGAASPYSDAQSVSQALAAAGHFTHPVDDTASPLSDIDYALRFNAAAYAKRLSALATHLGVIRLPSTATAAVSDGYGGIAGVRLASGEDITADLFVDCTGPSALLARAAGAIFASWSEHLTCNRLMRGATVDATALSVVDEAVARPLGWRLQTFGRDGIQSIVGYQSSLCSQDSAAAAMGTVPGEVIAFTPGRLREIWTGNVIAFGDAAVTFEPLHSSNMTLAHAQILLFLDLLPGRDIAPLERVEFNRRATAMADRMRDYIALFQCAPTPPDGPYWHDASSLLRSDSLSLTLSEYRKRGRLPFFEDDILPRDAWLSAMACIGMEPGRNALWRSLSPEETQRRTIEQQSRSCAALGLAPPYQIWLTQYIGTQR